MKNEILIILGFLWVSSCFLPVLGCDVNNYCVYNQPENITLKVINITSGTPIDDANCTIDIYFNNTLLTNGTTMSNLTDGFYYYQLSGYEINLTGLFNYYISVSKDSYHDLKIGHYEISNMTLMDEIDSVNTTTALIPANVWTYTSRTFTLDGVIAIAHAVWDSTINTIRSITGTGTIPTDPDWNVPANIPSDDNWWNTPPSDEEWG